MEICDYCENESISSWDIQLMSGVIVPIQACAQDYEKSKTQQEMTLSREAFSQLMKKI